jgi:catechol 2,3-dioxygenase-like lactoylglutathione lyase family enzyme
MGRLHHVIVDCPDPPALATFYSRLLGQPVTYETDGFCVVAENDRSSGLGFQRDDRYRPPTWPDPAVPQQLHLDVMVDDPAVAGAEAVRLGARRLDEGVYADPAGHPFCLVRRPTWAPPVADGS